MTQLNCRILLVDDYPAHRLLLRRILEEAGADVRTAEHGGVAVSLVFAAEGTERPYDLVITDLDMPVMGGNTMLVALRRLGYQGPVIAMSAYDGGDIAQLCLEKGFDAFVEKTFASERLVPAVSRVLKARRGRGGEEDADEPESPGTPPRR